MTAGVLAWLLLGCGGRLPSALDPAASPTTAATAALPLVDLDSAAAALVGTDPLLRRPAVRTDWQTIAGGEPIAAWARIYAEPRPMPADWWALERQWPGTLAVPLARGARLADLESILAAGLRTEDATRVVALLTPLADLDTVGPSDTRPPLAWTTPGALSTDPSKTVLRMAERSVLLGWLDGPDLPLGAASAALQPGIHDRLIDAPAGALLQARAAGLTDDQARLRGLHQLEQATTLALEVVAADRDEEQLRLKGLLADARAALGAAGVELSDDRQAPIDAALALARTELTADAGQDSSAGLALVALTAERLRNSCPEGACRGLDRVTTLRRAAAWHAQVAPLAATWRVIAAKQAIDRVEVTIGRPTFGASTADLVDVLLGEGAASVDLSLLRQQTAGPVTWLAITRATSAADATDAEDGLAALQRLLAEVCERALLIEADPTRRQLIERIQARASK